jgi:SAM-dependent methyltransferase
MDERPASEASDVAHWRDAAEQWIAWARAPGHDAFWAYAEAFAAFVGPDGGDALDIGCGEGRVSRRLGQAGWRMTAVDPVERLIAAARGAASADAYAVASAGALPFAEGSFDLCVLYNVLMDLDDPAAALREARRVLRPHGTLVVSLVHPLADRGRFEAAGGETRFVLGQDWFETRRFAATERRDGLEMPFAGWARPLGAYVAMSAAAGLGVTAFEEPRPDAAWTRFSRWRKVPLFLWTKARPLPRNPAA